MYYAILCTCYIMDQTLIVQYHIVCVTVLTVMILTGVKYIINKII